MVAQTTAVVLVSDVLNLRVSVSGEDAAHRAEAEVPDRQAGEETSLWRCRLVITRADEWNF